MNAYGPDPAEPREPQTPNPAIAASADIEAFNETYALVRELVEEVKQTREKVAALRAFCSAQTAAAGFDQRFLRAVQNSAWLVAPAIYPEIMRRVAEWAADNIAESELVAARLDAAIENLEAVRNGTK